MVFPEKQFASLRTLHTPFTTGFSSSLQAAVSEKLSKLSKGELTKNYFIPTAMCILKKAN